MLHQAAQHGTTSRANVLAKPTFINKLYHFRGTTITPLDLCNKINKKHTLFAVVTAGVKERSVEVEVVRLELGHAQYLLLAIFAQIINVFLQTLNS